MNIEDFNSNSHSPGDEDELDEDDDSPHTPDTPTDPAAPNGPNGANDQVINISSTLGGHSHNALITPTSSKNAPGGLSGMKDQLKGHLNGIYNSFSKLSVGEGGGGREDELSVGGKLGVVKGVGGGEAVVTSRTPFVVEKAIHNIMFIKHHMKRQDEFDAVSCIV